MLDAGMVLWSKQKLKLLCMLPVVSIHEFLSCLPVWFQFGNDSHKLFKYLLLTASTTFGAFPSRMGHILQIIDLRTSSPPPSQIFFCCCSVIVLSREQSQCVTSWQLWALWSIPRPKHRLERWHCSGDPINEYHTYEICHCGKWEIDCCPPV